MAKKNTPKKILAGAMALMSVAAYVPADGISSLVNNYSIVANAVEVPVPTAANEWVAQRNYKTAAGTTTVGKDNVKTGTINVDAMDFTKANGDSDAQKFVSGDYVTFESKNAPDVTVSSSSSSSSSDIGVDGAYTIINNLNITSDQNLTIKGTVIINGGSITMKNGKNITVSADAKLYLNNTTVTRTSETGNEAKEALILNKQGTVYINGSTVDDKATYVYEGDEDLAAIRNTRDGKDTGGKIVISDGAEVNKLVGLEPDGTEGKYKLKFEELSQGNSVIKSTGAAILNGALSELWVLGAEISGTSKVITTDASNQLINRAQGSVVPVVETSGNANFVSGSVTDSAGKYAVVAIEKWQKTASKTVTVNFGDGVEGSENKFTVTGGVSVADALTGDTTMAVNVNSGSNVGDVTMGLPGTAYDGKANTDVASHKDGMGSAIYYGGTLNVDGGTVGKVTMNQSVFNASYKEISDAPSDLKAKIEPGQVNVKSGTVTSVDIPVNENTRDAVNITGGTVTSAAPEFYQHTYVVEKTETTGDDAVVTFTLSCSEKETCDLAPIVVTFKKNQNFSKITQNDVKDDTNAVKAFTPAIEVSGGKKEGTTTIEWEEKEKSFDAESLSKVLCAAIEERGLDVEDKTPSSYRRGNRSCLEVKVAISGAGEAGLGYEGSVDKYTEENWKKPTVSITFESYTVAENGGVTTNPQTADLNIKLLDPSVQGFKIDDTKLDAFFGTSSAVFGGTKKTNYDVQYNINGLSKKFEPGDDEQGVSGYGNKGITLYKDAACKTALVNADKDMVYKTNQHLIKSITAEFSSDNGATWSATAKDCGVYKVRYILKFADSEKEDLKYEPDYTFTIVKSEFRAQAFAGNDVFNAGEKEGVTKPCNIKVSDIKGAQNDTGAKGIYYKWLVSGLDSNRNAILTDVGKTVFGKAANDDSTANLVVGTIGQKLSGAGGVFAAVDVYGDYTENGEFKNRQAGVIAEVYATKLGTNEVYSATDTLSAGVFEIKAKLSETNNNYSIKDEVLGYVVVDGITVEDASVKLPEYTFKYDGSRKQVDIDNMEVTVGGKALKYGVDFQVSGTYMAVKEGTYVFKIEGDGDYCGTKEVVWQVANDEKVAESDGLDISVRFEALSKEKINVSAIRNIPDGYKVSEFGVLIANDMDVNEDELVKGATTVKTTTSKTAKVVERKATKYMSSAMAFVKAAITPETGTTYAAKAYVVVTNADGEKLTIYSEMVKLKEYVALINHPDHSLYPVFNIEKDNGNVNRLRFTAVRSVADDYKDAGYTVKAMGILMDNKANNEGYNPAKKLYVDGDKETKAKGSEYVVGKVVGSSSAAGLKNFSAAITMAGNFNNPEEGASVRPYLVITKGNKDYYYYGEQYTIGEYQKVGDGTVSSTNAQREIKLAVEPEGPATAPSLS